VISERAARWLAREIRVERLSCALQVQLIDSTRGFVPGRVLVTGAAGQLGSFVTRSFADREVVPLGRAALDISDPDAVARAVAEVRPAVILNCAAFNDVDGAEDAPSAALATNAFGVRSLARAAGTCGATLVHYSTDFVFDGLATRPYDEAARPVPRSTYAASKLLGEWFASDAPRAFVLRVESLFGCVPGWPGRLGTLDSIVAALEQGREVRVFTDRVVSPSYLEDVVAATRFVIDAAPAPGLYHCVNSGHATWYEVAEEAARLLQITPRLRPVTLDEVALKATRPRFCALDNGKLAAAGFPMPLWRDAMSRWLAHTRSGRGLTVEAVNLRMNGPRNG
jgi:dTDP-4-dehydrorhamnose reductase